MSGASHDHAGGHHHHHLSGDFQFHEELASLFAPRPDAPMPMVMQQPWLFTDYLQASAPTPQLDYDDASFPGDFDVADDVVKRELVVDTGAAGSGGGTMSMSSTSSEACGAGAGAGEESAAGKCKTEEGEDQSKDGSAAATGDGEGQEKNKKG